MGPYFGSDTGTAHELSTTMYQDMNHATWNNFDDYEKLDDANDRPEHKMRMYVNLASILVPALCLLVEGTINKIYYPIGLGYIHMAYQCFYLLLNLIVYKV